MPCLLQLQAGGLLRQHDYGTRLHIYCSIYFLNLPLGVLDASKGSCCKLQYCGCTVAVCCFMNEFS